MFKPVFFSNNDFKSYNFKMGMTWSFAPFFSVVTVYMIFFFLYKMSLVSSELNEFLKVLKIFGILDFFYYFFFGMKKNFLLQDFFKFFFLFFFFVYSLMSGALYWIFEMSYMDDSVSYRELGVNKLINQEKNYSLGFFLMMISEMMVFFAFFWALFLGVISPAVALGLIWPPQGMPAIILLMPFLNTLGLLSSGFFLTKVHEKSKM